MLKNGFNHILRILVGHRAQRWWWRIISAVIHTISFQTGDVKDIGHFPVSWGVQHESVGTDGFGDAKRPTKRLLKLSGIKTCWLQFSKICIADREEPGVEKNWISHLEIVRAARLISFQNHLCLRFLQPLSQHTEIWHHLFGKLVCVEADFRHPVGTRDWYQQINRHPRHEFHLGPKRRSLEGLMVRWIVGELSQW